jgi:hypothetical protein
MDAYALGQLNICMPCRSSGTAATRLRAFPAATYNYGLRLCSWWLLLALWQQQESLDAAHGSDSLCMQHQQQQQYSIC